MVAATRAIAAESVGCHGVERAATAAIAAFRHPHRLQPVDERRRLAVDSLTLVVMGLVRPRDDEGSRSRRRRWVESDDLAASSARKEFEQRLPRRVDPADVSGRATRRIKAALCLHPDSRDRQPLLGRPAPRVPAARALLRARDGLRRRTTVDSVPRSSHTSQPGDDAPSASGGIITSDLVDTFVDLAGWLGLVDLVVHRRLDRPPPAASPRNSWSRRAGRARSITPAPLPYAASFVRAGVDSPMETRLRDAARARPDCPNPRSTTSCVTVTGRGYGATTSGTPMRGSWSSTTVASTPRTPTSGSRTSGDARSSTTKASASWS